MPRLPNFVIIGAQKAGTTAAARNLALHPEISVFSGTTEYGQKEIEFFNQHWNRGIEWYQSHFNSQAKAVGEKTAELLHRSVCHGRMSATIPKAKLVVILRSPVERSFSQWRMASLAKRDEPNDFESVIFEELRQIEDPTYQAHFSLCHEDRISCWREGYVLKGFYADQLEHLLHCYPAENVLVAISERIRKDMRKEYERVFRFLGVSALPLPFAEHFASPPTPPMSLRARNVLKQVYRTPNDRLRNLLRDEIPEWT